MLVGETVPGTLNDELDIDYFRFRVEPGQNLGAEGYVLEFVTGTLKQLRFRLDWPDGRSWRNTASDFRSWPPPGFLLTAKSSGGVFVAIDSLEGSVGTYTVKLVLGDNEPGD